MFCVRCGKSLNTDMTVCPSCRAPIPQRSRQNQPSPGAVSSPGPREVGQAVVQQKAADRPLSMEAMIGRTIAGRYRVMNKLGSGGMGSVFMAEDIQAKRIAAIKILSFELLENPEFVARFEREARTAVHIMHPNAVETFDSGKTEDGILYIAMEYLDGPSLTKIIKESSPLSLDRIVSFTRQAAEALEAGHRLNIVHRDFKPDNVIICRLPDGSERLKVLDFGVAKQTLLDPEAQKLTRTGFMVGTPQYISPEQLQGQPVGPPSDLYSLAVVVYEMLTGSLPFLGKTPQKQMLNRLLQSPMPFSMVNNNLFLPPDVEPVLMKALARNVDDRYSSALEFAGELERAARSKAVTSPAIPSFGGEMPAASPAAPVYSNTPYIPQGQSAPPLSNKIFWIGMAVAIVILIILIVIYMAIT